MSEHSPPKDRIFASPSYPKSFRFDEDVARVFDDMVMRSVPFYDLTMEHVLRWAERYYVPDTVIYDLGCSTGSTLHFLAKKMAQDFRAIGVDASDEMLQRAREKNIKYPFEFHCASLAKTPIENASVVIMNYTLQFIPPADRHKILSKIFAGMIPGGMLFLSEKLKSDSPDLQKIMTESYEQFKHNNGYSHEEIARKREALENILIPVSARNNEDALLHAGFSAVECILRWNNFASFVAIKSK